MYRYYVNIDSRTNPEESIQPYVLVVEAQRQI